MRLAFRPMAVAVLAMSTTALAQTSGPSTTDPRANLRGGFMDAAEAAKGMELIGHHARPDKFVDPSSPGDFSLINSDIAFKGNYLFQGSYNGFQVWDVSNPASPTLRLGFVCPGGQGDMSVYRNLLFMSVEETRGRIDCGTQGVKDSVSAERFRGVRIFDIADIDHPKQLAAVQTCRGSHTHTLVVDPTDAANVYVYVAGTGTVRPGAELAGCVADTLGVNPNTSYFRIEVIKVPLAAPQDAKVVSMPRLFADEQGHPNGLWKGGTHGDGTQDTYTTNMCHDITAYSAIGLAAGACSGNGILLDIRHPADPKRVAEVIDPNFAYWHSATFSNDGKTVLFSDEWGGGVGAKCRATDKMTWGADALFTIDKTNKMHLDGYYKMPAAQDSTKNCVAHDGSLIPVPGRDIAVQAFYQGGLSIFDFTDPSHVTEIAYFDRGPLDPTKLVLSGFWSGYWYNGHIYGSEIARGIDVFDLKPSDMLTQNEIDAAKSVHVDLLNVQNQQRIVWPTTFTLARAYLDQVMRSNGMPADRTKAIADQLSGAEHLDAGAKRDALKKLAKELDTDSRSATDQYHARLLYNTVKTLAEAGA